MVNRLHLVTFGPPNSPSNKIGILVDGQIVDLTKADSSLPTDVKSFLEQGQSAITRAREIAESGEHRIPLNEVTLKAPILNPEKIVCVGLNYKDHAKELKMDIPGEPVLFSKFTTAIIGPGESIVKPHQTQQLDYEIELVIVIGKTAKNVKKEEAMEYVGGYTIGNDVSARDWQQKTGNQWMIAKTWDTFAPIGPSILLNPILYSSAPSFNPHHLNVLCKLNGTAVQSSNTREFIFDVPTMIEYISQVVTLKPGDLIFTGTPPGVGVGRNPQLFMNDGDRIQCEIEELGVLENVIIDAPK